MSTGKLQPHYFLCEWYGPDAGKVFDLKGTKMQLGRNRDADIQILRSNVSRNHCTFQRCPRGWAIKDNGSQNGTYVNDEKVMKARLLKKEDRIHLGPPTLVSQGYIFGVRLPHEEYRVLHPVEMPWIYRKGKHLPTIKDSRAPEDHYKSGECSRPVINSPASVTSKRKSESKRNTRSKKRKLATDDREGFSSGEIAVTNQQNPCPSVKDLIKIPGAVVDQIETIINDSGVSKKMKKVWSSDMLEKYGPFIQTLDPVLPDSKPDENKKSENTCEEENSESLLDISILDDDPYPFSQRLDGDDSKSSKLECSEYENTHPRSCASCPQGQISKLIEAKDKINTDDETEKKLKELLLENAKLREQLAEEKKFKDEIAINNQDARKEVATEILGKLEEELMCNICTEILIKPVVLDCSHTFCEFCICEWKKKKKQCPICRNRIKSETTVLALERLIEKSVESLSPNAKAKRNEIIKAREQQQKKHVGSQRELRSRRRIQSPVRDVDGHRIEFQIGGLEVFDDTDDDDDDDDLSDMMIVNDVEDDDLVSSSDSDASVDGMGYYPGYGRCFNCGRRGHWANGCPEC